MGKGESVEIWPLRRPVPKKEFLKENLELPKERAKAIPEIVWMEMGPIVSSGVIEVWEIFEKYKKCKKEEDLILLARKMDNNKDWLGEEIKFFVARPAGISNDFLERKELFLIVDKETLKNLENK